jgi:cell division protein FtsZ
MEGKRRMDNAREGLENLEGLVDTLIVIPNDKLLEIVPDVSLVTAFKICDEVLVNAVKGVAELVTKPGLVNLDFADVRTVMSEGGMAMIGMGESDTENRAFEAVEKALNNPLITVDITGAKGALINVMGGPDITIREAQQICEMVAGKLSPDAKIIWGVQVVKELGDAVKAMLIVTGVKSPQIFGSEKSWVKEQRKDIEQILDVDFIE